MRFSFFCRTLEMGSIIALMTFAPSTLASAPQPQSAAPAKSSEEQVRESVATEKKHTFQDLLHGDPDAVADEKKFFALATDPELKQRVASILLGIGVRDQVYRDYLEHAAREALADETPWPDRHNAEGEPVDWNPVFLKWCEKRGLMPWATFRKVAYEVPTPWYYVAASGDPVFYDLLMQGLRSHNLMIVVWAAEGLAKLQDPRSIEPLIAAGRHAVGEARYGIGKSLLYFSDPRAQAAAEEFYASRQKELLELERKDAKEKGVKGLFQW